MRMAESMATTDLSTGTDEELELQAWKQETRRYLLKHVEPAVEGALQELERLDFLWGRIRLSKATQSPSIKADIRVEGHLVVYANVELRLAKPSRNWPVSGTLHQYCVLNQILEFHSVMQELLKRLQVLKAFLVAAHDDIQSEGPQCDVAFFTDMAQKVFEDLSVVCRELRTTANVLRLPSRRRFPYSAYVDHNFKPSLPPEIVVDFSIHRGELIMEVFGLALSQKPMTEIPPGCYAKKELLGCVCMCRNQKVKIVDYASTSIAIPQLDEMLSHLEEQTTWLVQIRDNVKALLDCQSPP